MKKFTVRDGFSFLLPDGTVASGGDAIELPDDIAATPDHRLEPVLSKAAAKAAAQADADAEAAAQAAQAASQTQQ